jgi:hypothetical protein
MWMDLLTQEERCYMTTVIQMEEIRRLRKSMLLKITARLKQKPTAPTADRVQLSIIRDYIRASW